MLQISARLFQKGTYRLQTVSRIYMTIVSLTDGHTVWPLEVIRKDAAGFDIGIGTEEMKEGHNYIIRVSNNWNLSPSASITFKVKEKVFPLLPLIPLLLSPLFLRKYEDKGITDVDSLVKYLKSQGMDETSIQEEMKRILKEVEMHQDVKIPVDASRPIVTKTWITQMDVRVCKFCQANAINFSKGLAAGTYYESDTEAPKVPEHPRCRCTYELQYERDNTDEFRAAAIMAQIPDLEMPLRAISIISKL